MPQAMIPRFRWLEHGAGEPPLLLLHGLMGEIDHWQPTLERLAPHCRALAPMLPIFDPGLRDISIHALAAWIVRLLDSLDIPRAVLGGNSLGGHVALEAALG